MKLIKLFALLLLTAGPAFGQVTEYALGASSNAGWVVYDSKRNVEWIAIETPSRVCSVTTSGTITCYDVPTTTTGMNGLLYDATSDKIYFTEQANKVGQFDPALGVANTTTGMTEWTH